MSNTCESSKGQDQFAQEQKLIDEQMSKIKNKIVILSGKGGVGKSTVALSTAMGLAAQGYKVGLLDIDIHGPSIPKMLKLKNKDIVPIGNKMLPIKFSDNLFVMSMAFFLKSDDQALIWRGPMKIGVIKQFLKDVEWGELDYLIVDSPPGTGDEPLTICQMIPDASGAIIVTTPQELAIVDVEKCISFCKTLKLNIYGIVENMSGVICPHCNGEFHPFGKGGGMLLADKFNVNYLGKLPLMPELMQKYDSGLESEEDFNTNVNQGMMKELLNNLLEAANAKKEIEV